MRAPRWGDLRSAERIAAAGALIAAGSLLLPWYGIELELFGGFSQSGLEAFNFGHAALLVTALGALAVVWACAAGHRPPRPLGEGGLLIAAGCWAAAIVTYLAVDRPDDIVGFTNVRLRYGIFAAFGGAGAILSGGLRLRQAPREGEASGAPTAV